MSTPSCSSRSVSASASSSPIASAISARSESSTHPSALARSTKAATRSPFAATASDVPAAFGPKTKPALTRAAALPQREADRVEVEHVGEGLRWVEPRLGEVRISRERLGERGPADRERERGAGAALRAVAQVVEGPVGGVLAAEP